VAKMMKPTPRTSDAKSKVPDGISIWFYRNPFKQRSEGPANLNWATPPNRTTSAQCTQSEYIMIKAHDPHRRTNLGLPAFTKNDAGVRTGAPGWSI